MLYNGGTAGTGGGRRRLGAAVAVLCSLSPAYAGAQFFREAPVLAQRVAAGSLPPVERRLPDNPMLLQPLDRPGDYGGSWGLAMVSRYDGLLLYRTIGYEPLVRWDPMWTRVVANVAQSFESNADASSFTFRLRRGLRWSDGRPMTSEDVVFWFEDVLNNPDITAAAPSILRSPVAGARLETPDAHTLRFTFPAPNSLFPLQLAAGQMERGPTDLPKHALTRYHLRYNPDADREAKAEGYRDWVERFLIKSQLLRAPSGPDALLRRRDADGTASLPAEPVPTLEAWVIDRLEAGSPPVLVAERNPYYWKIDSTGGQLPYIDRIETALTTSAAELPVLVRAGRVGLQARHFVVNDLAARALAEGGNRYRALPLLPTDANTVPIVFNLTHRDPVWRTLLQQRNFRVALSLLIDRRAIIDEVFGGKGEPYQIAPRPESRYYHQRLAHQYLDHDPDRANAILGGLGLDRPDADGLRLLPDGRPLSFTVLVRRDRPDSRKAMALVARQWRRAGIDAGIALVDRADTHNRIQANDFDAMVGHPEGGFDALLDAYAFAPLNWSSYFAPGWARWAMNSSDPQAVNPPPSVIRQIETYERIKGVADADAQHRMMGDVLDIAAEEFFTIGVSLPDAGRGVVRTDFRNIPKVMFETWLYPAPAPANPPLFFIERR
ncbi:ABC transporter substrate-binding protein [Azospirillum sp. RWY-5-1]|uniref:ABC transporter substrate-binding protein n=1 Tax=Azospirillum oleiclasticum TaxID=2735135 RepID=A0ABX2T5A1_9PROT|nr:ABC transporter substrate-binding protein [Azospirillum oleiclasticum]NYZ11855.1 ABC transporter substrate-binding protein [Azospirillum oleiclasticum]NYZ19015.1 ABC transporter substrate-binding protein [Azospirillum oleiclasticum]